MWWPFKRKQKRSNMDVLNTLWEGELEVEFFELFGRNVVLEKATLNQYAWSAWQAANHDIFLANKPPTWRLISFDPDAKKLVVKVLW